MGRRARRRRVLMEVNQLKGTVGSAVRRDTIRARVHLK
jgi:hypothetical protein